MKKPHSRIEQAKRKRAHNGIAVCTVGTNTHPNRRHKATQRVWASERRIARHLKVAPQTVAYWVTDVAEALPKAPLLSEVKEAEMDEMFTFIGDKKTKSTFLLQ